MIAWGIIGVIMRQVQGISTEPAPSWWDFAASNAMPILLPAVVVGVVAWIVERNIRRARTGL